MRKSDHRRATPWTTQDQDRLISCRDHILAALTVAMADRDKVHDLSWIDHERAAVAIAANEWAAAHGYPARFTVADVERIEIRAVGYFDYASKLALYIAEATIDSGENL